MKTHHEYRVERLARREVVGPSYAKQRGRETTRHARCATCGDRVVKACRCAEHFADWKHAKESRRGTEARSPKRAKKNAAKLSGRQFVKHRKASQRAKRAAEVTA